MPAMKRIVVDLDGREYQRLRERAQAEDRDAHQQARHIVRQVLQEETGDSQRQTPGDNTEVAR